MSKHIINWAVNNGDLVVDLTNPSAHLVKTVYILHNQYGIHIENRIYREELKESLGMNLFSPF